MQSKLDELLCRVENTYPGLKDTARLVLAVAATTRLNRTHPLAVILVGGPSSGKTSLLMPLTRGVSGSILSEAVLRIDDFTPASLVSHAANKNPEQLAKIDLLPRLKGKCVIVKEMAPMFTGHEEDLMRKFGVLASILDGEGHITGSGSYGLRGYTEKITFSLLGAVTPEVLSQKVYNSLSAVGPRFCFWVMPTRQVDVTKWRGHGSDRKKVEAETVDALTSFMNELFTEIPEGGIEREDFNIGESSVRLLSLIAVLMAMLRSKINYEKEGDGTFEASNVSQESPDRAFRYLEQIALGAAIIDARRSVMDCDLELALGVALSSATPKLRRMATLFFSADFPRTTHDLSLYLKMTDDTAVKYAGQLELLGLIERVNYDGTTQWDLKSSFQDLRSLFKSSEISRTPVPSNDQVGSTPTSEMFNFENAP